MGVGGKRKLELKTDGDEAIIPCLLLVASDSGMAAADGSTHFSQERKKTKNGVSFWLNSIFRQAMEDESVKCQRSRRGARATAFTMATRRNSRLTAQKEKSRTAYYVERHPTVSASCVLDMASPTVLKRMSSISIARFFLA